MAVGCPTGLSQKSTKFQQWRVATFEAYSLQVIAEVGFGSTKRLSWRAGAKARMVPMTMEREVTS
jgi:hypothetical protein